MKNITTYLIVLLLFTTSLTYAQSVSQWRGINRDGKYAEKNLLKNWPEGGPALLWSIEDMGSGYGSFAVTTDEIFVNGLADSICNTYAYDLKGNLLWKTPNGKKYNTPRYHTEFSGTHSTPTVVENLVYVNSEMGRIACLEKKTGKEKWSVDMMKDFGGIMVQHGYAESLLIDDNLMFCFPGGKNINIAALDRFTGKPVWTSKVMGDTVSYCSPIIIKFLTRKILVTFSGSYIIGLDAKTGELLWSQKQAYHMYHQQCNTPVFADGSLYYSAGEGNGAVRLDLSSDGSSYKEVWRKSYIKNLQGGFVKIKDLIFTPDKDQRLKCIDTKTGQVIDSIRVNKGSLIYADSMLYCYSDNGDMSLVKVNGSKMEVAGKFKINKGQKEHFAHPVIDKGVLYIRHGKAIMAYDIKRSI